MMRRVTSILIVVIALATVAAFFIARNRMGKGVQLKAYFANAHQLRVGAPVMIAGMQVGTVLRVDLYPERRETPVEVLMGIGPEFAAKIPGDANVSLKTTGLLGETYPDIDVSRATGSAAIDGAELRSVETDIMDNKALLNHVETMMNKFTSDNEKLVDRMEAARDSIEKQRPGSNTQEKRR